MTESARFPRTRRCLVAGLLLVAYAGCSVRRLAAGSFADVLAGGGDVFATDDDPELVRAALPFALKTMEALVLEMPEDGDLLLATSRGFTQYAYAFVETDAVFVEDEDYDAAVALRERALRLYLRALAYGLRGLELTYPGIGDELSRQPATAAARIGGDEVGLAFWTASAWGAAISLALDRPELVADIDAARALLGRVLELDEGFDGGAVHETLIRVESLPEMMGGSPQRAREHFERAIELAGGNSASPYVALAASSSVGDQDRAEFEQLLTLALEVDVDADPGRRLANLIAQRRARHLLSIADELFLEPLD